jgi:hydrogenase nickel incorporation protein HypA/HybF
MHEASLLRDLMRKIDALAAEQNAKRVTDVYIWLGALSHFSPKHFRGYFLQASSRTIADGAVLHIEQSTDARDPDAQGVLLRSLEVEK